MTWLLPPLPPTWSAALRDVHARDPSARVAAAERLSAPEPAQRDAALAGLQTLAGDRHVRVRCAAIVSLGELADARAMPQLTAALEDPDATVRELALLAFARLPSEHALPVVTAATTSPHPELRFQAIALLAELDASAAAARAPRLLRDPVGRVRASAARAIAQLVPEFGTPELRVALVSALNDADAQVRREAALPLARLSEPRARDGLLEAIDDPVLAWEALDAAPLLADPQIQERVAALAQSFLRARPLKAAAARALARMGDARAVPALRAVLHGLRGDGRTLAAEIAGELGISELASDLARLASRPRGTDLVTLATALGRLAAENPEARAALRRLALRDDEAGRQSHAALARLSNDPSAMP